MNQKIDRKNIVWREFRFQSIKNILVLKQRKRY